MAAEWDQPLALGDDRTPDTKEPPDAHKSPSKHLLLISQQTFAVTLALVVAAVSARPEPPVSQYLPPNQQYPPPAPNPQYGPPQPGGSTGGRGPFGQSPLAPSGPGGQGFNKYLPPNQQYGPPSQQYGPPGTGGGKYDGDSSNVPAKYEFEYTVKDVESGNDFGHKESREGDFAKGVYYVLLPDGRRQTVEYEADQDGYRPKVTYTQEGPGVGNGNAGGYPSGGSGYRY
ncbi:pro-resilin-like [Orussus abietinus]|uniref:pro-resilin-like n=1 Tax=Orussus abietinus TaxID=222816 RepID=UPI000626899D|nr:pro-resilin-like [Orussus abietinus]